MDKDALYLWLSLAMLSQSKEDKLLEYATSIEALYDNFDTICASGIMDSLKISQDKRQLLLRFRDDTYLSNRLHSMYLEGIRVVNIESDCYPTMLRDIAEPPKLLYAKGNIDLLASPSVAVIGTRHSSRYGQAATKRLVRDMVDCGITIVSGLATGIDTYAHTEAIEYGGRTIAVLGGGFGHISPSTNVNLSRQIASSKDGLLLSEYAPNIESIGFMFVRRNRIVAGISMASVVVEAGVKSGALITANITLEQGKTVFAVPGNVDSPQSIGTNDLIKQGATLVTNGFDIATDLHIAQKGQKNITNSPLALDFFEEKIYTLLLQGAMPFDDMLSSLECTVRELMVILSTMEIKKLVTKQPNNYYTIA